MSKRASSKYKLDRRMGENIWGRPKSPVNKRSYGPGQHGQRRAKKLSDYGNAASRLSRSSRSYYAATSPSVSSANIIPTPRAVPATPAKT